MKRYIFLLLCLLATRTAMGQATPFQAGYPTTLPSSSNLGNGANNAKSTLNGTITSGATTLVVASAATFPAAPFPLTINNEIVIVTAKSGTTFTITRGAFSTIAASHSTGATVNLNVVWGYHSVLESEVINIATLLGTNASQAHPTTDFVPVGVSSSGFLWKQLVNANIDPSAAIAYSKLNLTGAILNADLAGSIAYTKLLLTGAILNADLAGSIANNKLANSSITVTATSPLTTGGSVSLGGTVSIGCQAASGSQAGCLSSTDWTTFNSKQNALVNSAGLAAAISDETGTIKAVFSDSPVFTTNITAPLVIGGTGVSSTLTLKSTSGSGTSDAIIFQTGNNGAIAAGRFLTGGKLRLDPGAVFRGTTAKFFGDSITVGFGATNPYSTLYGNVTAQTITNSAVNGSQAADQADAIYATTVTAGANYVYTIGTNDARLYLTDANKLQVFVNAHMAELAWLAIPQANKFYGIDTTNISYAGSWSDDPAYGIGRASSTNGSTATASVYGTSVYVGIIALDGNAGTLSVTIDGVSQGSFNCFGPATVATANGRGYAPRLLRFPGLSNSLHTVVVAVTSSTGGPNVVYLDWFAGNGAINRSEEPDVYVGNVIRMTAAGYAASGGTDANVSTYNTAIANNVRTLASDGLNIYLMDMASVINPLTDLQADGVHPTDSGQQKMANLCIKSVDVLAGPKARQSSSASIDLANLGTTNINSALLFQSGIDVGSTTKPARDIFITDTAGYGTSYGRFTGTFTGARVITVPDSSTKIPVSAQLLTFTGPTAGRTITLPDAAFTAARTDAGQTFTGTQAFGAITGTTLNGNTFTSGSYVLTGSASKTLTFSNTLTLAGTDSTTITFQGTDTYVGRATTDTLTNKTLTGPIIANVAASGNDFSVTNNSVAAIKSIDSGAVVNTIVASAGKTGHGTASPGYKLDILDASATTQMHFGQAADSGGYLISNSSGTAYMSAGAILNAGGSAWVAKSTTSVLFGATAGTIAFYQDSALTPGNTFTPTQRFAISTTGVITFNTTNYASCIGLTTTAGALVTCTASDANLKEDIQSFGGGLDSIRKVSPALFKWREGTQYSDGGKLHLGLIAQDLHKANPLFASQMGNGLWQPDPLALHAAEIDAIKTLDAKITALERQIEQLKSRK